MVPGIGRFPHYVPYILKFHAVVAFLHGAERQFNHRLLLLNNAATIIRPATPADAAAIRELALQIWPDTYLPIIGPEQLAYMLNLFYTEEVLMAQMQGADQRYLLLCEGDEPMGFASFSDLGGGKCKLNKLYVRTDRQGGGLGRMLLQHIVMEAAATGADTLILNVNRHNHHAIGFYGKFGFSQVAVEDITIGGGYFMNDYIYALPLK